jgi:protoporphyrinogen/coproporphyrinogen III oxidase
MDQTTDIAIVGGGITGLTAAHALAKRGVAFVLLEAAARFGGVIRTERAAGFLLEGGPDSLLAQKPAGIALCQELGLGERLVPTNAAARSVFVLHGGRLHPLPEGMMLAVPTRLLPLARSGLFSWRGKLRMGLDLVIPARRSTEDESIASFLRRRFGQECVDRLGEPLLAGIHAGDPEHLSIRATFPRFVDLEREHGSLIRGLLARTPGRGGGSSTGFVSLAGGMEDLVTGLVSALPAECLRVARPVRWVHRSGPWLTAVLATGPALRARAVILAAPAPKAAAMLEPLAPSAAGFLANVPFASTATILLGYRRVDVNHGLDGYGFVVPRAAGLRSSAVTFVSTKLPGRAPEGHVLLRVFVGGVRDPRALDLDDEALVAAVTQELRPLLGICGEPVVRRVFRWPSATPQLEVGHLERWAGVERELESVPGLFLAGAGLRGTGIPDCISDGIRAAEAALAFIAEAAA